MTSPAVCPWTDNKAVSAVTSDTLKSPAIVNREMVFSTASCDVVSVSMRNDGSLPRITRTTPINRPCTVGNTDGIQEFAASDFMSFVMSPLRNIVASDPLTLIRPRAADKSISPAPPSRTISYSVMLFFHLCNLWMALATT